MAPRRDTGHDGDDEAALDCATAREMAAGRERPRMPLAPGDNYTKKDASLSSDGGAHWPMTTLYRDGRTVLGATAG